MLSFPIVKNLDIFKADVAHLGAGRESLAKDPLVFKAIEPAFSRRVVPAARSGSGCLNSIPRFISGARVVG